MKKIVYILRAVPGSGKSTVAENLTSDRNKSSIVCSADDYFMVDGEYKWDKNRLNSAHNWCRYLFEENLKDETEIIVLDNTNIRNKEVSEYRDLAIEYGYRVFVLVVENWHSGENIHNVPEETLVKMEHTLRCNIKLR